MLQTNSQIIAVILAIVIILLFVGLIILLFAAYYTNDKKRLIKEKEVLKATYEKAILELRIEVQEQTMQTIGADLHDNIGQLLSLVSLTLGSIDLNDDIQKANKKIEASRDLTLQSINELRLLGKLLEGDQLATMGIAEAIAYEVKWIEKSDRFEVIHTEEGEKPQERNHDKDLVLFRIMQEALNNIIKHARANKITLQLAYKPLAIDLQIIDNGKGFDMTRLSANKKGMGLLNLHKRAQLVGGEVVIQSQPGKGTHITIHIPYP